MKLFRQITIFISLLLMVAAAGGTLAQTLGDTDVVFAALIDGALTIHQADGTLVTVDNPPHRMIEGLVWNADGTKLAYALYDEDYSKHIMVTDAQGSAPVRLATGRLEAGFPFAFLPDDSILYVGQVDFLLDGSQYRPQLLRIAPEAGAQPETFGPGSMDYRVGCGGGSSFPGDWQYWDESRGFGGNALSLQLTDYGLLHSVNCGGVGLALLDLNSGDSQLIGPEGMDDAGHVDSALARAVVSPDGKWLAAVRNQYSAAGIARSLALVNLETLEITDLTTAAQPDQLAWGSDGTLFYSSAMQSHDLAAELTAEQSAALERALGYAFDFLPAYTVAIHSLNPATGEEAELYSADAYFIGRMAAADGRLLFSQIANGLDWLRGLADGTINMMTDETGEAQRAAVPVGLYQLDLSSGAVTQIGADVRQFTLAG
jgi:hypothetical protein